MVVILQNSRPTSKLNGSKTSRYRPITVRALGRNFTQRRCPGIRSRSLYSRIGEIDAKLIHDDKAFRALSKEKRSEYDQMIRLTDRITLSQLWVLGAYEVTRTLDERFRNRPKVLTKRLGQQILTTKKAFARVRIPLAKFEPAGAHRSTDFAVAFPAMHRDLGISWKVANRLFVPRRQLSDKLLCLLSAIQEHQDRRVVNSRCNGEL